MKTGVRPCIVGLPLFLEWGITFDGKYEIQRNEMKKVTYVNLREMEKNILWEGGGRYAAPVLPGLGDFGMEMPREEKSEESDEAPGPRVRVRTE